MKETIKAECPACKGTGVFSGTAEPKGVGVVCLDCKGSGMIIISYTPFTSRKTRDDIHTVRQAFVLRSEIPLDVTYQEFLDGVMPK